MWFYLASKDETHKLSGAVHFLQVKPEKKHFHEFVLCCVFVISSLHPPRHPPHPECQSLVPTLGYRHVRWSPFLPAPLPPFGCVGQSGPSAAGRRSCLTSAVAGPGAEIGNIHQKAIKSSFQLGLLANLHCLHVFPTFPRTPFKHHREGRLCI